MKKFWSDAVGYLAIYLMVMIPVTIWLVKNGNPNAVWTFCHMLKWCME